MAEVSVSIAGRDYMVSCADGEEERLESLGAIVDGKLRDGIDPGALSETRALLYASIFLADELKDRRDGSGPDAPGIDARSAKALENLADRIEAFASRLENGAGNA